MKKNIFGAIVLIAAIALTGCGNKNPKGQDQRGPKEQVKEAEMKPRLLKSKDEQLPPRMLIIVDPQVDFIDGSLATAKGAEAIGRLSKALSAEAWKNYSWIIVTQDMHPENHCSFVAQGGTFPPHCVKGTKGVEVYPDLKATLTELMDSNMQVHYMRKGDKAEKEEFSIFQNDHSGEKLRRTIQEFENFEGIDVCGIATDYCVYETVKDLIEFYPAKQVRVITNCCAAVDENDDKLAKLMKEKGIEGIEL